MGPGPKGTQAGPAWVGVGGPLRSPQVPGRRQTLHRGSLHRAAHGHPQTLIRHLLHPALCWTLGPGGGRVSAARSRAAWEVCVLASFPRGH